MDMWMQPSAGRGSGERNAGMSDNLNEFYQRCENFDWYFDFSDDGRVFREGASGYAKLEAEATRRRKRF